MARALICNGLVWVFNDAPDALTRRWATPDAIGFLPAFLNAADSRPATEQLDANYGYGGYWRCDQHGMTRGMSLTYPDDPPLAWAAQATLRDERIIIYPYAMVAVVQKDGSFVVQRMD